MVVGSPSTAYLFPGQGSQEVGMGKQLAGTFPVAAEVFQEADEIVGFPISKLCWEGPAETLDDTVNTQPALLAHSVAALRVLQAERPDLQPELTAGHSMGEYSALVCAGSMQFADALRLVRARGEAMQHAGQLTPGGMAAVLGLETEAVEAICRTASQDSGAVVQLANDNCPGQVVISGSEGGLEAAIEALRQAGARRVIKLAVSIAAHSQLMLPAQQRLKQALETTAIEPPQIPVIGNVSAQPLASVDDIRAELSAQLTSRVRWTETIGAMLARGATQFVELGPKDVLSKLAQRIGSGISTRSVGAPEDLLLLAS